MNKAKRVAWHKHLKKAKRLAEKTQAQRAAQPRQQTTPRR